MYSIFKRCSVVLVGLLCAQLTGCFTDDSAKLEVVDPYVRAIPSGRTVTAAFFTLDNKSDQTCHLVAATADNVERAELHNHILEDGLMKMREVDKVVVPAGEQTIFKPGGLHIMLYGVSRNMSHGDKIQLTLEFEDCDNLAVDAEVRHPNKE
ncbi:copper chaperone PCu(A)C [Porticoccaceae bacterium LTM1]|nr:copper chaperone PCu(A)C [Porticoccaceae bacterium LTM1]